MKKDSALGAAKTHEPEPEDVVRAKAEQDAADAPEVDLVVRKGVVRKIIIHMPEGKQLELDCVYEGEEEDEE